jgi:hypothetical protein
MEWQDAAGLAQLSQSVEDVFSSGNLPKAAETLATMRHCLSAVGEVFYFLYKKNTNFIFNLFPFANKKVSFRLQSLQM